MPSCSDHMDAALQHCLSERTFMGSLGLGCWYESSSSMDVSVSSTWRRGESGSRWQQVSAGGATATVSCIQGCCVCGELRQAM